MWFFMNNIKAISALLGVLIGWGMAPSVASNKKADNGKIIKVYSKDLTEFRNVVLDECQDSTTFYVTKDHKIRLGIGRAPVGALDCVSSQSVMDGNFDNEYYRVINIESKESLNGLTGEQYFKTFKMERDISEFSDIVCAILMAEYFQPENLEDYGHIGLEKRKEVARMFLNLPAVQFAFAMFNQWIDDSTAIDPPTASDFTLIKGDEERTKALVNLVDYVLEKFGIVKMDRVKLIQTLEDSSDEGTLIWVEQGGPDREEKIRALKEKGREYANEFWEDSFIDGAYLSAAPQRLGYIFGALDPNNFIESFITVIHELGHVYDELVHGWSSPNEDVSVLFELAAVTLNPELLRAYRKTCLGVDRGTQFAIFAYIDLLLSNEKDCSSLLNIERIFDIRKNETGMSQETAQFFEKLQQHPDLKKKGEQLILEKIELITGTLQLKPKDILKILKLIGVSMLYPDSFVNAVGLLTNENNAGKSVSELCRRTAEKTSENLYERLEATAQKTQKSWNASMGDLQAAAMQQRVERRLTNPRKEIPHICNIY